MSDINNKKVLYVKNFVKKVNEQQQSVKNIVIQIFSKKGMS